MQCVCCCIAVPQLSRCSHRVQGRQEEGDHRGRTRSGVWAQPLGERLARCALFRPALAMPQCLCVQGTCSELPCFVRQRILPPATCLARECLALRRTRQSWAVRATSSSFSSSWSVPGAGWAVAVWEAAAWGGSRLLARALRRVHQDHLWLVCSLSSTCLHRCSPLAGRPHCSQDTAAGGRLAAPAPTRAA